jgi:AcrR family transcriptional regulator
LKTAAVELFTERGFAAVTAAQIASRAGISERTFFRHFKVKEDVLFEDYSGVRDALRSAAAAAPAAARPREIMQAVADLLSERFDGQREEHRRFAALVSGEPALRAREALLEHEWGGAIAEGLAARGFSRPRAALVAATLAATFRVVHVEWVRDGSDVNLARRFAAALAALAEDIG